MLLLGVCACEFRCDEFFKCGLAVDSEGLNCLLDLLMVTMVVWSANICYMDRMAGEVGESMWDVLSVLEPLAFLPQGLVEPLNDLH